MPRLHAVRRLWPYAAATALCLLAGWAAWQWVFTTRLNGEKTAAAQRLDFFTLSLEAALNRNEALPALMALERKLGAVLDEPAVPRDAANHYLETVAQAAKLSAAYVMDSRGLTLAASNWAQPVTFVGRNYGFRPYVLDAMAGRFGRFYGIGATSGEPGYFLAARLRSPRGAQGVIAIKLTLDPFEDALRQSGEAVLVADQQGVVLLSSVAEWKYRELEPLDAAARERLAGTQQYGDQPLPPLVPDVAVGLGRDAVRLARAGVETDFSIVRRPVGNLGWQMLVLTDQRGSRGVANVAAVAAVALAACTIALYLYVRLTRRQREDRRLAGQALRRASEELEVRIAHRTADLTAANAELERSVAQLRQTESILRETRDAAVQAGKLAVLGQMSAGMTHELNQPLAALHTLSDNAVNLLDQHRTGEARENLTLIGQLAARMGSIVTQLKAFARKEPPTLAAVALEPAVAHALMILEGKRKEAGAAIEVAPMPPALRVRADAIRLEQVLVNLLGNALDAVAGREQRVLRVAALDEGGAVRITITDSGPGIAAEALPRLFEPFFTTKPAGQGLGLGLALSLTIAQSFGGRLEARNTDGAGAEFSLVLETA